jgi:hypothetical protein
VGARGKEARFRGLGVWLSVTESLGHSNIAKLQKAGQPIPRIQHKRRTREMTTKKHVTKSKKQAKGSLRHGKKLGSTRTLFQPIDGHR